ncbi:hypothetical protein IWQ60_002782 [Tieghemiomyces parasiticus]|uniref:Uncharacterized protein n=1 Tax=Tieghemiomyces parasiticus TaxID=78921 RepID=A0A9W8AC22_9FUNG|nr:hypothetical protein IWQ60_002782 [Tieghemiomyces parasiticus]
MAKPALPSTHPSSLSGPAATVKIELPIEKPEFTAALANTSNWNSMLLAARQKRGPCFDPATGMYHFPRNSTLYYSVTDPVRWRPGSNGEGTS